MTALGNARAKFEPIFERQQLAVHDGTHAILRANCCNRSNGREEPTMQDLVDRIKIS